MRVNKLTEGKLKKVLTEKQLEKLINDGYTCGDCGNYYVCKHNKIGAVNVTSKICDTFEH
jgi:hypothetical protein